MKILIVYAKAGAGHRRAAEAVFSAFKRRGQDEGISLMDCLDYTNAWFKNFYPQSYLFLVRFLPLVWAGIYYALENRCFYSLFKPLRRLNNALVSGRFRRFLRKENPEVIVSTQFFASEVAAALKKSKKITSTLISVVTDFGAHTFWEAEDVDIFVAASEDSRKDLIARHIPAEKIRVLGIPIEPPLGIRANIKQELRKEIEMDENRFTVLIVGGGFGVGPIKELVFSLNSLRAEIKDKLQVLVVCSRNKKLLKEMEQVSRKLTVKIKTFGFVPNLYKMMSASDVIISKSGGLTTSESLASGLPMIIISPIPGQETKNCELLVKNGAAVRIDRAYEVKKAITEFIEKPDKIEKMHQKALNMGHPHSADRIVELVNSYIQK